jgi:hypothetical protein
VRVAVLAEVSEKKSNEGACSGEGNPLGNADQALSPVLSPINERLVLRVIITKVADGRPLREPPNSNITPTQTLHLLRPLRQVLPRDHLVTIIPLAPILVHGDIRAELARIKVPHADIDGSVDDLRLQVIAKVSERHEDGVEAAECIYVVVRTRHDLHAVGGKGLQGRVLGGVGGMRFAVEGGEAHEVLFLAEKLATQGQADCHHWAYDKDGLECRRYCRQRICLRNRRLRWLCSPDFKVHAHL